MTQEIHVAFTKAPKSHLSIHFVLFIDPFIQQVFIKHDSMPDSARCSDSKMKSSIFSTLPWPQCQERWAVTSPGILGERYLSKWVGGTGTR